MVLNQRQVFIVVSDWEPYLGSHVLWVFCGWLDVDVGKLERRMSPRFCVWEVSGLGSGLWTGIVDPYLGYSYCSEL